jgi:hypothetical protein
MNTPASGLSLPSHSEVSVLPLPPPPSRSEVMAGQSNPSLPYQSIQISAQTTLAGHSMPSASRPGSVTPVQRLPSSPLAYPQGSLPPQLQPLAPATPARSMRRLVVILLVAVIVTTAGIIIVVTVS